jgi:hypothetical protein
VAEQVERLLGVDESGDWANTDILRHISAMTCTQIHILGRDASSWRTCFMLVGYKVSGRFHTRRIGRGHVHVLRHL